MEVQGLIKKTWLAEEYWRDNTS